ncbi:ferredoxin [Patescibacteria group bacterium]|nr:ferredoxin [Patescibacteria group bacterium]MBU1702984.1 ferredoxin [Patescibacteria group bacterium]MBU1953603.1 ferredoxin [Patescibacteria group bacterium]
MKSRKVIHKRATCIGCNSCVFLAPQTWEMDTKTGKSKLINAVKKGDLYVGEIYDCDVEANKRAEKACPMRIIKVEKA